MSDVVGAVQDATARVAHLLLHQNKDVFRLSAEMRDRAKLIPRGQSENVILFSFPTPVVRDDHETFSAGHIEHISEQAVRELIANLPESGDDRTTLETLPGRRVPIRAAVSTLARAVQSSGDLRLELANRSGTADLSVLTREQALEVPSLLSTERNEVETILIEGVLDGMRTRRRLFYIIESEDRGGREFEGSIGPEHLEAIQESVGQYVIARLQKTTKVRDDGSRSRAVYSLLDLQIPQTF